jgi:putative zinc finger/helix-turn-helix YgiT family protein
MDTSPRSRDGTICGNCRLGQLETIRIDDSFEFLGEDGPIRIVAQDVPFYHCPHCGERLSGLETAQVHHRAICKALGLLTPEEIRGIRDRLGMTQAEFSGLTGIGEATISRWERGRLLQNRANDRYLRLVAGLPQSVSLLRELQVPAST